MLYIFKGGNEFVKMMINRATLEFEIATSRTHYKFVTQPYSKIFDSKEEEESAKQLNDDEFQRKLAAVMARNGYILVKKSK